MEDNAERTGTRTHQCCVLIVAWEDSIDESELSTIEGDFLLVKGSTINIELV